MSSRARWEGGATVLTMDEDWEETEVWLMYCWWPWLWLLKLNWGDVGVEWEEVLSDFLSVRWWLVLSCCCCSAAPCADAAPPVASNVCWRPPKNPFPVLSSPRLSREGCNERRRRIDLIIEFNGKGIFGVLSGQDLREQCVTLLLEQLNTICLRMSIRLFQARISRK